ncbi:ABC transporter permease [Pontibacillus marinus]|uniref:ABC-2 type transporter transmembrane domain-containing protein n=1 Tax=Pontibacillus marinus BH030004 = DSM 16465 TaxID=1385511 RepID=A0A0A5HR98_9BACI|nr:ABC transporter permease [Pontibacillus marinus]KGX86157.1 hypothetical protein N783_12615 [Pontibacillus marinus BH030004 = DSM 16465]
MNKFWVIFTHTFMTRLKSKAFIWTTVISLVFVLGLTNIDRIMDQFGGDEKAAEVAVIDESGELFSGLEQQLSTQKDVVDIQQFDGTKEEAKQAVKDEEYKGYLHLSYNESNIPEAQYFANQIAENKVSGRLQQAIQQLKVAVATEKAGIDQGTIQQIYAPVAFEKVALQENAKTQEELNKARGLVYIMLFLLYMGVIMYGNMIAMDVAKEKSSRVMEILISSASPVKQMFGKILGIALLGVLQFGLILIVGYQSIKANMSDDGIGAFLGLSDLDMDTLIYSIVFFLLGYLLYATLAAMLGSLVSRIEDAQQLITPMTLMIVVVFMVAMFGLNAPDSTLITVTSYIPFFTPMVMFLRVGMLDVPFWEAGISILLLIATTIVLGIIGARIYRGGVLLYGKSSSLKDIKTAIQLSKKESS